MTRPGDIAVSDGGNAHVRLARLAGQPLEGRLPSRGANGVRHRLPPPDAHAMTRSRAHFRSDRHESASCPLAENLGPQLLHLAQAQQRILRLAAADGAAG